MVCYTQAVVYFAVTTGNLELVTGSVGAHIAAVLDQHRPGMSEPLGILKRSGQPADDWVAAGAAGARLLEAAAERCGAKTLSVEESLLVIAAMPNAAMYGREMVELHLNVKLSQLVAPIRIVK